ncbi:ABC transporter substrate-binding protein [Arthrobacter sp. 35W]|uniref:ABC transporter substrate-binding protein n=1 Tax=Arthrobacter sp. 35W TaxID=1132441 RepID=UPI00040CD227|nr:ABC transporter substrate-binding protein [Arthrobacter sp. 35W]
MKLKHLATAVASAAVIALGATACGSAAATGPSAANPQTATILMNWFAQAEQGGYWDAMQNQTVKDSGVTLKVQQGGPGIQTIAQVAAGQSDFGIANADDVMVARKNGLPIVAVAAAYDTNLQCIMSHKAIGATSFEALNGHQISRVPSPYFDYLKSHFKLDNIEEINYTGSLADFKRNDNLALQCYVTSDVYNAEKEGIDINVLNIAKDGGYNPYGLLLFTTDKLVKEKPELVKSVVKASVAGWKSFQADPTAAKTAVMAANKDADSATFDAAVKTIKDGNYLGASIGSMTEERWNTLRDQLASIGQVPAGFDAKTAYTNDFLPK